MNINDITTLISTLGFPIVCCVALFWQGKKNDDAHAEEVKSLSKAIENNTLALQKLVDKLGG